MLEMEFDWLVVNILQNRELYLQPIINSSLDMVPPIRGLESF